MFILEGVTTAPQGKAGFSYPERAWPCAAMRKDGKISS